MFLYDDYNYREIENDDVFFKIKTTLFVTPDCIIGKKPNKQEIARQLEAKRKFLYSRKNLFCEDCLMQDHDVVVFGRPDKCPICGFKNVKMVSC